MASEHPHPSALPAGTQVGEYKVLSLLGSGGQGTLYKVSRGGKVFALKFSARSPAEISPATRADVEARTRREVGTLLITSHPNVVRVLEFGRWPDVETGHDYLVMDFVDGERLYAWQSQRKPSLRHLAGVFLQLASALGELHRHGIIHRDIKSDNVLVRADGQPVLIDFGIAHTSSAHTLTGAGAAIGTSTHLSSDYCRHLTDLRNATTHYNFCPADDLHALGFMLYEMLSGRRPFDLEGKGSWEIWSTIARQVPRSPREHNPAAPESLAAIAMKLLEKEPDARFAGASALAEALEQALGGADASWDAPFALPAPASGKRPSFDAHGKPSPPAGGVADLLLDDSAVAPTREASPAPEQPAQAAREGAAAPQAAAPGPASKFQPPTAAGFNPPEAPRSPRVEAPPPARPSLPSELRAATEQLAPPASASRKTVVLTAAGALVLGLAVAVAIGSLRGQPHPRSLLEQYPKTEPPATPLSSPSQAAMVAQSPGAPATNPATPPATVSNPTAAPPPPGPPARGPRAEAPRRAARGDEVRSPSTPKLLAAAPSPAPAAPDAQGSPSWLKGADVVGEPAPAPASGSPRKLGVGLGTHMKARLRTTLDSRTLGSGLVEAVLTRPVARGGQALVPARSMAYGRAEAAGGRFIVRFTKLRLPDDVELSIKASAVDPSDSRPGLAPGRRIQPLDSRGQDNPVAAAARGAANVLLGRVGGDALSDSAGAAGRELLNHREPSPTASAQEVIILDAGHEIELVVEEAF